MSASSHVAMDSPQHPRVPFEISWLTSLEMPNTFLPASIRFPEPRFSCLAGKSSIPARCGWWSAARPRRNLGGILSMGPTELPRLVEDQRRRHRACCPCEMNTIDAANCHRVQSLCEFPVGRKPASEVDHTGSLARGCRCLKNPINRHDAIRIIFGNVRTVRCNCGI